MELKTPPTLSAPGDWDRYYQVKTDLAPILDTPGIASASVGESLSAAGGSFVQTADEGYFLVADSPIRRDPVEVCAEITGAPASGAFATASGMRRRHLRQTYTGTHAKVESLVRGARVIGSEMQVHEDTDGIFAITGRPLGEIAARDPGEPPVVDEAEALSTCAERFELDEGLEEARVEQVVFPEEEGATWAYEVAFLVRDHAADVRVYLRADDLSVLLSYNVSSSAAGRARVHPINPLRTPDLIDVTFDDLDEPGDFLHGPAIDVRQGAGVRLDRPGGDFTADPADPGFDEAQAYYHLQRVGAYFSTIVAPGLLQQRPFTPMTAVVNDPASPNNAYYQPSTGELSFGLFADRSSARSASMVYHEFGHAVTDAICELGRSAVRNGPARGLSEGYSDYFAAALLDDPRFADYVTGQPNGARNCSDPSLHFAADHVGEEHDTGAVWAAVLWAIRQRMDPGDADRLAIGSVDFLGPSSSFDDARAALHSADEKLFAGANQSVIDEEYDARSD
jgi:hypothetical protein